MTTAFRFISVLIFLVCSNANALLVEKPTIIGVLENVGITDLDMVLPARIDTGAGMTSVHARIIDIKRGKDDAADRVVFFVVDADGKEKVFEKDIDHWVRIKKKGNTGVIRRPVVLMNYCLAGKQLEAHTNLANRSRFKYPLLIGRNILASGDYLINSNINFAHNSACNTTAQTTNELPLQAN